MSKDSISHILSKVGEGKRWKTLADLIQYCKDTCKALGPACCIAGGAFGWKWSELIPMLESKQVDPTCLIHGKKMSKHLCLYCCLCFKPLTPEECNVMENGKKEDVCKPCAAKEKTLLKESEDKND